MKIGFLIVLVSTILLAGCSTMNGFVGQEGVGLELKNEKGTPTGFTADTTHTKDLSPPLPPEDNGPTMDVF